jgi:acetoin utilization protein AcuB
MLVKEYMTPNPVSVDGDASILEAAERMKESKVRRFPVLREDELIGIVTDRDLRSAAPSQVISFDSQERKLMPELHSFLSNVKIKDIMAHEVVAVGPEQTIVAAAQLMLQHRISGLPVVDSRGRLLGIITETDIFKVLVDLSGSSSGKTTFALHLEDRPGSIREVADRIRAGGGRLASILTSYTLADPRFRRVYIRIMDLPSEQLQALEDELRQHFELLYTSRDDIGAPSSPVT